MTIIVHLNGVPYSIPQTGGTGWGQETTNYLQAIAGGGLLQLQGGAFTLTSDVNFGPNYGLLSPYFKSGQANPASAGVLRLTQTEGVYWRNAANTGDLGLTVSSDNLYFNGTLINTSPAGNYVLKAGDTMTGSLVLDYAGAQLQVLSTTTASASVSLKDSNTTGNNLISSVGDNLTYTALGYQAFTTNSLERLRVDASGNVLINTTSPVASSLLTVSGTVSASNPTDPTHLTTKSYVDAIVISPILGPVIATVSGTSQAASAGYQYILTNTGSATTVTLPASPSIGDVLWVTNTTGRVDCVIANNGNLLMGLSQNMTINVLNVNVELRYINNTIGWRVL